MIVEFCLSPVPCGTQVANAEAFAPLEPSPRTKTGAVRAPLLTGYPNGQHPAWVKGYKGHNNPTKSLRRG